MTEIVTTYRVWAQGRPRPYRANKGKRGWHKPQRLQKWQKAVWLQCLAGCDTPSEPHKGPVELYLTFYWPMPKSWPKWKKDWYEGEPRCKTPDWDNCAKAVVDAIEGVLFKDDRQVSKATVETLWSDPPGGVDVKVAVYKQQPKLKKDTEL